MNKLSLIFIALLFFAACKKEVTELPPATETGANTFGAKVNGEFWIPQGFGPIPANDILTSQLFPNGDVRIRAKNFASSPNETEFDLFITGVTAPGTYLLNVNSGYPGLSSSYGHFVKRKINPIDEWITTSTYTGSVTITRVDQLTRIVSGTFQFTAGSIYNAGQTLSVTEGRFHLKTQ